MSKIAYTTTPTELTPQENVDILYRRHPSCFSTQDLLRELRRRKVVEDVVIARRVAALPGAESDTARRVHEGLASEMCKQLLDDHTISAYWRRDTGARSRINPLYKAAVMLTTVDTSRDTTLRDPA